jgi:hypothetical protein
MFPEEVTKSSYRIEVGGALQNVEEFCEGDWQPPLLGRDRRGLLVFDLGTSCQSLDELVSA